MDSRKWRIEHTHKGELRRARLEVASVPSSEGGEGLRQWAWLGQEEMRGGLNELSVFFLIFRQPHRLRGPRGS